MKKGLTAFVTISILICAIPLIGMIFRPTTESTENRAMATFPGIRDEDGSFNVEFFREFEDYFSDHFAFRNELVYGDAVIQSSVFKVSSTDRVVRGTDGWLFYQSTLNDYLGLDRMSEREIYNTAHNLYLVDTYLKNKGIKFTLTIPPNKNTLYNGNMPYYDNYIVDGTHDLDKLEPVLSELGVGYTDLLKLFREEGEVLYLKKDSHWNNRGALMAYDLIMRDLGKSHDDYSDVTPTRAQEEAGDLSKMLYTFYGGKELNYRYDINYTYEYNEEFQSVEDGRIETKGTGSENLLMFRDSFGNTLIPFFAEQFENSYFTKEMPYGLEGLLESFDADYVVFEKVERNLRDFITMPPIISPLQVEAMEAPEDKSMEESDSATISIESLNYDFNYYKISGTIKEGLLERNTDILVDIGGKCYYSYHTGDSGYELYIKKEDLASFPVSVRIILTNTSNNDHNNTIIKNDVFNEGDVQ